jgi:hypothetical protein
MDSWGTFENSAVPQPVKKFPAFYETEGSFPCSQNPTTWHSSLSTALKYWKLNQRVKKDQRKRQNTEPVPIVTFDGRRFLSKSCLTPSTNLSGDPPPVTFPIATTVRHAAANSCTMSYKNLSCDRYDSPRASGRFFSLSYLQLMFPITPPYPNKTVVISWQNNTTCLLSLLYFMEQWIWNSVKQHCTLSNAFHSISVKCRCDVTTRILFFSRHF